jgi:hypothetical protein
LAEASPFRALGLVRRQNCQRVLTLELARFALPPKWHKKEP